MVPVLTEVATGSPEALFFPIFQPAGDFLTDQAHGVPGLEETVLLTDAALLNDGFMSLPQSAGVYFSGPDLRFGATSNESTAKTPETLLAAYEATYGEPPSAPYWGPRLRRHHPSARSDRGRLHGAGRHPGHRPGRDPAVPERGERLQRDNRHHQLRQLRGTAAPRRPQSSTTSIRAT